MKGVHISNLYHIFIKGELAKDKLPETLEKLQNLHRDWTEVHLVKLRAVFGKIPKPSKDQVEFMQDNIDVAALTYATNLIRRDLGHHQKESDAIPPSTLNLSQETPKVIEKLIASGQLSISKDFKDIKFATEDIEGAKLYWIPPLRKE